MSLAGELKDTSSKPNESKYGLYESVANRVVAAQDSTAIVQIVKHRQSRCKCSRSRAVASAVGRRRRCTARSLTASMRRLMRTEQQSEADRRWLLSFGSGCALSPSCRTAAAVVMVEGAEQYGRTYIVPDLLGHILHLLADPEGKNEVRAWEQCDALGHC